MARATEDRTALELWAADARPKRQPPFPVAGLLRALANERRLEVLRVLARGRANAETIAQELRIAPAVVRKDLIALARAGLVRPDETGTEVYQLAQHAVGLLQSALAYRAWGAPPALPNGRARAGLPVPPLACTVCDNRGFVSGVLGDLKAALDDARQYHAQIKEMSSQVLTAHEAERKRIARELHDDTAQALTSILVRLRLLERSTADAEVLKNVEELRELTGGALDSVRRMAMDLRPAALDDLGLVPALQTYAEKLSESWPVQVTVSVEGVTRRLPPEVELVLYRVVQEALNNVAKHARAANARVSLARRHNEVTLVVEDDGVGFSAEQARRPDGTGLGHFGMRERLALVGGEVDIESATGTGTKVTARVPLAPRRGKAGRTK
jgi:signal transduction histidine kinase